MREDIDCAWTGVLMCELSRSIERIQEHDAYVVGGGKLIGARCQSPVLACRLIPRLVFSIIMDDA